MFITGVLSVTDTGRAYPLCYQTSHALILVQTTQLEFFGSYNIKGGIFELDQ